jgi:hypothetical protein
MKKKSNCYNNITQTNNMPIPSHEEIVGVISSKPHPLQEQILKRGPQLKGAEEYAKKLTGIEVPRGILPAIYAQESSAGNNDTNYNPKIGESAWLYGLTNNAKQELMTNPKTKTEKWDFHTQQGAANAAATYWALRSNIYGYDKKTNTQTLDKTAAEKYKANEGLRYIERYNGLGAKKFGPDELKKVQENFNTSYGQLKNIDYSGGSNV